MKLISAVVLAAMVTVVTAGRVEPAAAASSESAVRVSQATGSGKPTDISARHHVRRYRHSRYGYYPPYDARYYARPYYYEPDPYYAPLPFGFSFGIGRW